MISTLLFLSLFLVTVLSGHSKEEWKSRTIYQLLTDRFSPSDNSKPACNNKGNYCGGTFRGIIKELDYIQGMGFDAIWISPVVDNVDGGYHGYWARNWNKVNSHFGSEQDLKDLVSACHNRGIWVMVDVVANHVGPVGTNYGSIEPFNRAEHYHDYCDITDADFKNHNQNKIENCRLAKLPDLKQENTWVQEQLYSWVRNLVNNYNIDGLRVDTTPEVPKWFWQKFKSAAGVFTLGEVFDGSLDYLRGYIGSLDSVLNYGIFFQLRDTFKGQSFNNLASKISEVRNKFGNELNYMGTFVDNHDNARFLHGHGVWDHLEGALLFSCFFTGIPIVYYGDEQGYGGGDDPQNREELWTNLNTNSEIYKMLKKVIAVRKNYKVWNYEYKEIARKDYMLAFSRGTVMVVLTHNKAIDEDISNVPFPNGAKLCDAISDYSDCTIVRNGKVHLSIAVNKNKVFVKS